MKLLDKYTGATYEPADEGVAAMMQASPRFEQVEDKPKAASKRKAKPKADE